MIVPYKIKFSVVIFILIIVAIMPVKSFAQRFSHTNGGNNSSFNRSTQVTRSAPSTVQNRTVEAPVNRTINGGSINNGNHNLNRNNTVKPVPFTAPKRPVENVQVNRGNNNVRENVNVYHSANQPYHPYAYHPYHPYSWGPSWHPIGFFAASLAADAFFFSFLNQQYYYDNGVYYEASSGGYIVVTPPVGSIVNSLPIGYENIQLGDYTFYYYGGVFYTVTDQGYQVVAAPFGAVVTQIPDGATEQDINGQSYLVYNNTYYQPVLQNGQDAYQVVQVN